MSDQPHPMAASSVYYVPVRCSRGGPRGDRAGQVARTSRGMAALDRGGAQARTGVAAGPHGFCASRGSARARMGGSRGRSGPAGTMARDRIRLWDHHLFCRRARARAMGSSPAASRDRSSGNPVPASAVRVSGDAGHRRHGGRVCGRHRQARNHRPSRADGAGMERRAGGLRRAARRARAIRPHRRAPRAR